MVIFNEKEHIEKEMSKKDFCIRTTDVLFMVIRYYTFLGFDVNEVREKVLSHDCSERIRVYVEDDYFYTGFAVKANTRELFTEKPIWVTKYEYDFVHQIGDVEQEKILFALLVIQKFLGKNSFYLSYKDVKKLSMTQKEKQGLKDCLYKLEADGYISIYDNKRYRVNTNYMKVLKSENFLLIDNYEKISLPYLRTLKTDEYFYCERCGRRTTYNDNDIKNRKSRKYCKSCSSKVKNHVKN